MARITTIFSDVGGVLLTNGWDTSSRHAACARFGLDIDDFERRHHACIADFETGRILTDEYLNRTVFHAPRSFAPQAFRDFMWDESQPKPDSLEIVARLARSGRYLMGTLNNESRDLNLHRIEKFGLRNYFTFFFTSSFLGVMKPEEAVYRIALAVTQRPPGECLFIDDRAENLEAPRRLGIQTIQFQTAAQLFKDLGTLGIDIP